MSIQVKEEKGTPQTPPSEGRGSRNSKPEPSTEPPTLTTPGEGEPSTAAAAAATTTKKPSAMFIAYKFITRKRVLTEELVKRHTSEESTDHKPLSKRARKKGRLDTYDADPSDERDDDGRDSATSTSGGLKEEDWDEDATTTTSGRRGGQNRRRQDRQRGASTSINQETTRCVCGKKDEEGTMVQCERCLVWQHMHCMGLTSPPPQKRKYFCELCRPRDVKCLCGLTHVNGKFVQCSKCAKFQHSACAGVYVKPFSTDGDETTKNYICFNCAIERTHHHHHTPSTAAASSSSSTAASQSTENTTATTPIPTSASEATSPGNAATSTTTNTTGAPNTPATSSSSGATVATGSSGMSGSGNGDHERSGEVTTTTNNTTTTSNNVKNRSVSPSPRKGKKSASIASTIFAYVSSSWVRNELTEDWNSQPWLANNRAHRQKKRKTIIPIGTAYDMSIIQKYLIKLVNRTETGANVLPSATTTTATSASASSDAGVPSSGDNEVIVKGLSTYFNCNEGAVLDIFNALVVPYAPTPAAAASAAASLPPAARAPVKREPFAYTDRTAYPDDVVAALPDLAAAAFPGILTSVPSAAVRGAAERVAESEAKDSGSSGGIRAAEPLRKGAFVCEVCGTVADPRKLDEEIASQNSDSEAPIISDAGAYDGVFFYPPYPQSTFCIDARTAGNAAAHGLRRSCAPNAELRAFVVAGNNNGNGAGDRYARLGLFATEDVAEGAELTVAFDYCWKALSKRPHCGCGKAEEDCEVARWFAMRDRAFTAAFPCVQKLIYIDPPVTSAMTSTAAGTSGTSSTGAAAAAGGGKGAEAQQSGSAGTTSATTGTTATTSGSGRSKVIRELDEGRESNTPKKGKKRPSYMAGLETPDWGESREGTSSREYRKIKQIEEMFRKQESREQKKKRSNAHVQQGKKSRRRGGGGGDDTSPSDSSGSSASSPSTR